jgi:tetratricopeptide (TPR) repeat protein
VSLNRVAMLLEARGALAEATAHAGRALDVVQQLAAEDASNVDWQRELGRTHYRVGLIADGRGDLAAALSHLQQALAILDRAASLDPLTLARQRDLADAHAALAQHFLAARDWAAAAREAGAAQAVADRLLDRGRDDLQAIRLRGLTLSLHGRAAFRQGSRARATELFTLADGTLSAVAASSRDYAMLDPWAFALAGLGRQEEAREVVRRLGGIGYRNPLFVAAFGRTGAAVPPRVPVNLR